VFAATAFSCRGLSSIGSAGGTAELLSAGHVAGALRVSALGALLCCGHISSQTDAKLRLGCSGGAGGSPLPKASAGSQSNGS